MKLNQMRQLKNDIELFNNNKYINLSKTSVKEYISILDMWINKLEENEKLHYYKALFRRKPYVKLETLINYHNEMKYIEDTIHQALINYPEFDGIDFCDVGFDGVGIRGFHKKINGYKYGQTIKIDYEFNNYINCIRQFVEMWKEIDNPEKVKLQDNFIEQGNKYGWD